MLSRECPKQSELQPQFRNITSGCYGAILGRWPWTEKAEVIQLLAWYLNWHQLTSSSWKNTRSTRSSNNLAMSNAKGKDGWCLPFSIALTDCRATPNISPSSACDKPRLVLNSRTIFLNCLLDYINHRQRRMRQKRLVHIGMTKKTAIPDTVQETPILPQKTRLRPHQLT